MLWFRSMLLVLLGIIFLPGRLWADRRADVSTPLVLYADYVNQQMGQMAVIHTQVQLFNQDLNRYQATFVAETSAGQQQAISSVTLRFSNPLSTENIRFFEVSGAALRGQLSASQQNGQGDTPSTILQQFDQLEQAWGRIVGICRELERHSTNGSQPDLHDLPSCYERIQEIAVLFEDYGILKERLYFALKHPTGAANNAVADDPYKQAEFALSNLIESSRYLLHVARAGTDLTRAHQRLEASISQASATYQQVQTALTRTYPEGAQMMNAYLKTVAAAKQLSAAATAGKDAEPPAAYNELGKAYYDCNTRFWPLLYQTGTGMIAHFNLFSESQRNRTSPMLLEVKWIKPLVVDLPPVQAVLPAVAAQTPNHLILLFDNSGSMNSPEKLSLFQQATRRLIEAMPAQDRLSVVTFSGESRLLITADAEADRKTSLAKVNQLTCKGESPVLEGLDIAYLEALTPQYPNENKRIVMITDGGFAIPAEMPGRIEERSYQQISLSIYYVGKDDQHSRRRLSKLAAIGKGSYERLLHPEQLIARFYPQAAAQPR